MIRFFRLQTNEMLSLSTRFLRIQHLLFIVCWQKSGKEMIPMEERGVHSNDSWEAVPLIKHIAL